LARVAACVFSGSEGVAFNQKRTNRAIVSTEIPMSRSNRWVIRLR
jgi:hypothetical protein